MISIIVPIYKVEAYLEKCIQSILAQTFTDFELILIDDGSPDNCGKICDEYAKRDSRIRIIHQKNQGLSCARNAGTAIARGEYITYIDSDDTIHPRMLEILYAAATAQNADISACDYRTVKSLNLPNEEFASIPPALAINGREATLRIMRDNQVSFIIACAKLYKNTLVPLLRFPEGKNHEDEYVTYKALYCSERIAFTPLPLYNYLQRSSSITATISVENCRNLLDALQAAIDFFEASNDEEMLLLARKRYFIELKLTWTQQYHAATRDTAFLLKIIDEWRAYNRKYGRKLARYMSTNDRITRILFHISPKLYDLVTRQIDAVIAFILKRRSKK